MAEKIHELMVALQIECLALRINKLFINARLRTQKQREQKLPLLNKSNWNKLYLIHPNVPAERSINRSELQSI